MLGETNIENTVAVLFGGRSSEHEISLRSCVYVLKNLPEKYRIIPVGITRDGAFRSLEGTFTSKDFSSVTPEDLGLIVEGRLPLLFARSSVVPSMIFPARREVVTKLPESQLRVLNLETGVVFPVLHGPNGEDGRLQGLLELAELPYVGCDTRASVVGIDKDIAKRLCRDAGIPVAKYECIDAEEWEDDAKNILARITKNLGFPCFVKPNALGSAVGVNRAKNEDELAKHIKEALIFDEKVLIEEAMMGTEVEVAFLGTASRPRVTVAGEVSTDDFYTYEVKYLTDQGSKSYIPARLENERMIELQGLARTLAHTFGLFGLCRLDFWNCKKTGRFVFNEINTLPGLTSISQFPQLWDHMGVRPEIWLEELVVGAKTRQKRRNAMHYGRSAV